MILHYFCPQSTFAVPPNLLCCCLQEHGAEGWHFKRPAVALTPKTKPPRERPPLGQLRLPGHRELEIASPGGGPGCCSQLTAAPGDWAHAVDAPALPPGRLREGGINTSSVTRLRDSCMEGAKNSTMVLDRSGFMAMLPAIDLPS